MISNWNELPLILDVANLQDILAGSSNTKPSKETVYAMMNSYKFPLIKGTKSLKVSRDAFREWLMNPSGRS